jgi:hypothetical protein
MSDPQEITFQSGQPHVGQVTLFTDEEETRLVFAGRRKSDGSPVRTASLSRSRRVRREEILGVRGLVAQRLRVAFIEDVSTSETDGRKERVVGPFAGGTFEIEREDDSAALIVYDGSGAPATYGASAQIAGLYRGFGRAGEVDIKLPHGPQRVGQEAPEIAESMAAGVTRGTAISKVESPEATLAEIRPGPAGALHGLYRVALKVTGESGGSLITLDLKGTILLRDVDGAPLEVRLQGPLATGPDPNAASNVPIPSGSGELKLVHTMVYGKA